jgi:GMP synthase (glutamine-hydrolysing)
VPRHLADRWAAPIGLILSGGPASVYVEDAFRMDPAILDLRIPILGICYGHQLLADLGGGVVANTGGAEYGNTTLDVVADSVLLSDLPVSQQVWMSHRDQVTGVPPGFVCVARTPGADVAAMEDRERSLYGVQFHPEVAHTPRGTEILKNFLHDVCGAIPSWTSHSIIEAQVAAIREQVGAGRVICGLSGGVDSAVAAVVARRSVTNTAICVDHGLSGPVRRSKWKDLPFPLRRRPLTREAADRFLEQLEGMRSRSAHDHRDLHSGVQKPLLHGRATYLVRARSTPTSSNPALARRRPSRPITTSADCPKTCHWS